MCVGSIIELMCFGLQAIKAHVLLSWPNETRQQQGRRELNVLLDRTPPVTDANALCVIDWNAYTRNDDDDRFESMWERATSASPKDENLHQTWCRITFQDLRWKAAQKVWLVPANVDYKSRNAKRSLCKPGVFEIHEELSKEASTFLLDYNC